MKSNSWRTRLDEVKDTFSLLNDRHERLKLDFNKLSEKYVVTKACVLDSVWRYIPEHCKDFKLIPNLDTSLVESPEEVGKWEILDSLGTGQFSVVKRCRRWNENEEYAIKMICKDKYRTVDSILRAENEVKALTAIGNHPNILSAHEVLHGKVGFYIVTEIMSMDLFDFSEKYKDILNDDIAGNIVSCLLAGLNHLWDSGLVHRDLKPENVLASFDGIGKDLPPRSPSFQCFSLLYS